MTLPSAMCNRNQNLRPGIFCLAAILLSSPLMLAQAAPGPAQQATPPSGAQSASIPYTLHVPVPMVIEDVVILDHDDHPVRGLKASDLTVTEDGKPVTLQYFQEHSQAPAQPPAAAPDLGPNVFGNIIATSTTDTLNVLLLDALNTPITDQALMRQQMLDYLKTLPPGLSIAVFGLNNQLYMLQGFTTDPKVLVAAIEQSKKTVQASSLLDHPVSDAPEQKMSDFVAQGLDLSQNALMLANIQQFERQVQIGQTDLRVQYTLQALNQLARYLSGLPGRKNVIWFSGSFPLDFIPDPTLPQSIMAIADFQDDVRKTTDLLARNQVAVYPVDGRGLFTDAALDASQSGQTMARIAAGSGKAPTVGPGAFRGAVGTNSADRAGSYSDTLHQFDKMTAAEHATMSLIADSTGGKAFFDTNGLKETLEKAISDGSNYYTFAYAPPDQRLDGSLRRIEVKLDQPGLHLSYRKSYFADNMNEALHGKKVLPQTAMQTAMMRGGPNATQITFIVQAVPDDKQVDTVSQGTKPSSKLMKPPYVRYSLVYGVDIRDIVFSTTPDGVRHGTFEFAAVVYNADGEALNQASNTVSLDLPAKRYAQMLTEGLRVGQLIEAPAKGDYFLRTGILDVPGDRIGTTEFSLSSLKSKPAMTDDATKHSQPSATKRP